MVFFTPRKLWRIGSGLVLLGLVVLLVARQPSRRLATNMAVTYGTVSADASQTKNQQPSTNAVNGIPTPRAKVVVPIGGLVGRITKKRFGQYITPQNSPVQPEKFTGYHTGVDAETGEDEKTADVQVVAIADGTIVFAGHVDGYGGLLAIRVKVDEETATAVYGHIRLSSVTKKRGESVGAGEPLAVLGTGYSAETDGERKHLHFGLVRGAALDYRGYVQKSPALTGWQDPAAWLSAHGA